MCFDNSFHRLRFCYSHSILFMQDKFCVLSLNSGLAKLRAVRNVQQPKKYISWAYDKTDPPAGLRNFLVYEAALSILAHRYLYICIDYYFTTFSINDWRSIDMMLIWCQNVVSPSHHIYIYMHIYIYIYTYIYINIYLQMHMISANILCLYELFSIRFHAA